MKLIFSLLVVALVGMASAEIQPLPRAGFREWAAQAGSKLTSVLGDRAKKTIERLNELIAATEKHLENAKAALEKTSSTIQIPGAQQLVDELLDQLDAFKDAKARAEAILNGNKA